MNDEMMTTEVGARLHEEFDQLTAPPGPTTAAILRSGRRRRGRRLATVGSLAVVGAVGLATPIVLNTGGSSDQLAPAASGTPGPKVQGHKGFSCEGKRRPGDPPLLTAKQAEQFTKKVETTVRTELRRVAPGVEITETGLGIICGTRSEVMLNGEFKYQGELGHLEVSLSSKRPGQPAARAHQVVTTGDRVNAGLASPNLVADIERTQRDLGGGTHAIVYPKGVDFWFVPVDVFGPHGVNVKVGIGYGINRTITPSPTTAPEQDPEGLTPADIALTVDQLLAIGKAVAAINPP